MKHSLILFFIFSTNFLFSAAPDAQDTDILFKGPLVSFINPEAAQKKLNENLKKATEADAAWLKKIQQARSRSATPTQTHNDPLAIDQIDKRRSQSTAS